MKKLLPLFLCLVVVVVGFVVFRSSETDTSQNKDSSSAPPPGSSDNNSGPGPGSPPNIRDGMVKDIQAGNLGINKAPSTGEENEGVDDFDDRSATEIYRSAAEALAAIKEGAKDYDDLVLEQFTDLGEGCTWCEPFYQEVKGLLLAADTKEDQKSYYAEVLAISGRLDNIQTLVDAIKQAPNTDTAELYAEALELASGNQEVTAFLSEQLSTTNELLREATVAAITNQGSRAAIETLYKHTAEKGDPDGYYSIGIGLGEVVPEPEALPLLQELMMKRDSYAHLPTKALLNSGLDGVKIVFDVLNSSKNADFDREMVKGASEHVNYDEETVEFLKQVANSSKQPVAVQFAKDILDDFALEEGDEEDEVEENQ